MNKRRKPGKRNSRNAENPFRDKILTFLRKKTGKTYKPKEISKALNVNKNTYHQFRNALDELVNDGHVARLKGPKFTSTASLQSVRGNLQITRKGFGFVPDERTEKDIFIPAENLNTALDGDLVEVRLFAARRGKNQEGQITKVLERARTRFVGTFHKSQYYCFVRPDNAKVYRDFFVPPEAENGAKDGQKVLVEMKAWESSQLNPAGVVVEILGFPDEPGVDISSVVMGFGLPITFDKKLEKAARRIDLQMSAAELNNRLDLREEIIFTIDPEDAKDFDDAVSLKYLENGNIELGVHIADVSHFVNPGSDLDKEALQRGTSVYLVDRVIPMLPEHLSNNLCSLRPDEDRLTYSCIMQFSPAGEPVAYELRPSVINSKRRFSYEEVQTVIEDQNSPDPFAPVIHAMHKLSRKLREKRFENGSIDFSTAEIKFKLDKKGRPVEIIPVTHLHSHEMIEEFMLAANQTVARHVYKIANHRVPNPFVFRIHEKPDSEKLHKFRDVMNALGHKTKLKRNFSPRDFQEILQSIEGGKDEPLIKQVALRTMMKAIYSTKNIGHFGLAFRDYTHFTSPIRRYPDLAVHRLLKEYEQPVNNRRRKDLKRELNHICDVSSRRERLAQEAERESIRLKQVEWMARHQDEIFDGLISGVTSFGIFVETIPFLIEGLIRMEALDDDFYIFNEKTYELIGKDTGRSLRLGDPVRVRVAKIEPERKEIDFKLVE